VRGGGLRGGSFSAQASFEGSLRLSGYAFVPGLRVSGSLSSSEGAISGTVHVSGTATGTLKISRSGTVTGTLGGRHVRFRPKRQAASATLRNGGSLWPRTFAPRRMPLVP
jgi:hypothetical protein